MTSLSLELLSYFDIKEPSAPPTEANAKDNIIIPDPFGMSIQWKMVR